MMERGKKQSLKKNATGSRSPMRRDRFTPNQGKGESIRREEVDRSGEGGRKAKWTVRIGQEHVAAPGGEESQKLKMERRCGVPSQGTHMHRKKSGKVQCSGAEGSRA